MTAPVRIEAAAWTDIRYQALALILGLPDRDVALIRCATIWRWQTEHYTDDAPTYSVSAAVVIGALGKDGPAAIVAADLAELEPDGRLRIRGGRDPKGKSRIDWLWRDREARRGSAKSGGEERRRQVEAAGPAGRVAGRFVSAPAAHQPDDQLPTSCPPAGTTRPPPSQSQSQSTREEEPPLPPKGGTVEIGQARSKPKRQRPTDYTPDELASAERILGKITERTGVAYQGSREHLRLIVGRLREPGVDEWDLRAVVAYCWKSLDWQSKPEMHAYLRPETLFGPQTIAKYLPGARKFRAEAEGDKARGPPPPRVEVRPVFTNAEE